MVVSPGLHSTGLAALKMACPVYPQDTQPLVFTRAPQLDPGQWQIPLAEVVEWLLRDHIPVAKVKAAPRLL